MRSPVAVADMQFRQVFTARALVAAQFCSQYAERGTLPVAKVRERRMEARMVAAQSAHGGAVKVEGDKSYNSFESFLFSKHHSLQHISLHLSVPCHSLEVRKRALPHITIDLGLPERLCHSHHLQSAQQLSTMHHALLFTSVPPLVALSTPYGVPRRAAAPSINYSVSRSSCSSSIAGRISPHNITLTASTSSADVSPFSSSAYQLPPYSSSFSILRTSETPPLPTIVATRRAASETYNPHITPNTFHPTNNLDCLPRDCAWNHRGNTPGLHVVLFGTFTRAR